MSYFRNRRVIASSIYSTDVVVYMAFRAENGCAEACGVSEHLNPEGKKPDYWLQINEILSSQKTFYLAFWVQAVVIIRHMVAIWLVVTVGFFVREMRCFMYVLF